MPHKIVKIYFSDFSNVTPSQIQDYGAFDISLVNDLPLFIDPFLLFNSDNDIYQDLHEKIIEYVKILKAESEKPTPQGKLEALYYFPEVKENWLGYSKIGNKGRGLGKKFAESLQANLKNVFKDFGDEKNTGAHLGKLSLIKDGVGRDQISDFTCNLIKGFLCEYTQNFAKKHIDSKLCRVTMVSKCSFNTKTMTWASKQYYLPKYGDEFVLLTPIDLLTKDSLWINQQDLIEDFSMIVASVSNDQLRATISEYFSGLLPVDPTQREVEKAAEKAVEKYPEILDTYVGIKEKLHHEASLTSSNKVNYARSIYVDRVRPFADLINLKTGFYQTAADSHSAARQRAQFLKHVIEAEDGYRLFWVDNAPIHREADIQIMFKLTWFASAFDANAEVNNGRGPADFVISHGSRDKSVVEFKLASNSKLEQNLEVQAEIYSNASRATHPPIKVIIYYSESERLKVEGILNRLGLSKSKDIILIDATPNKVSASKAVA